MFEILKINKENLLKPSGKYICEDDIYGILLKSGQYIKAKDNIYLIIIICFLINII